LQKTLNHAGPAMTARYYHLDSSASRDALEKFAPQFGRIVATAELPASVSPDENLEADDDRDESAII